MKGQQEKPWVTLASANGMLLPASRQEGAMEIYGHKVQKMPLMRFSSANLQIKHAHVNCKEFASNHFFHKFVIN